MKQRPRRYFTQTEMAEVFDRRKLGESLNSIARSLERSHSAVQGMLSRTGGIRPAVKRRSQLALTMAEREEISRGVAAGLSLRNFVFQLSTRDAAVPPIYGPLNQQKQSIGNRTMPAANRDPHRISIRSTE